MYFLQADSHLHNGKCGFIQEILWLMTVGTSVRGPTNCCMKISRHAPPPLSLLIKINAPSKTFVYTEPIQIQFKLISHSIRAVFHRWFHAVNTKHTSPIREPFIST